MDANEPDILIGGREQLVYLLAEAAEIEHGLMCCYLYAAYSLKGPDAEGLSADEKAAVARWRSAIVDVAIDEMLHLSLVSNLLAAVGSNPHFQRQNFPVSPGYHPAGVVVSLAPFSKATLDHFVYLERPEGTVEPDGEGFESPVRYERVARPDRLVPSATDYATVGHLYRGIRAGFAHLASTLGEAALFAGDPNAQVGTEIAPIDGLVKVTDLASAQRAIDVIVEQGEGAPGHHERSHYARFVNVRDELQALSRARPSLSPAHPVARNPVMRKPPEPAGKVHVEDPGTARVLDLGNAVYGYALRCLARAFGQNDDTASARARLVEASFTAMRALGPTMQLLAAMPVGPAHPGVTAGLTFTMERQTVGFAQKRAGWAVLVERGREIARAAETIAREVTPGVRRIAEDFAAVASSLAETGKASGEAMAGAYAAAPAPAAAGGSPGAGGPSRGSPANASAPADVPAPAAGTKAPPIEEARAERVILRFEGKRCIHSRHCVLDAPDVFLANVKGPWLHPEAVSPDELAEIAHSCPSGAITYERTDGGPQEQAPRVNVARIRENGPLAVHAAIDLEGHGTMFRATLCRCGASKNKPFCDNAHLKLPFVATGEPATQASDPLPRRDGTLTVSPMRNGPLAVQGNLEICAGTGRTVKRVTTARLCRCGGSSSKPFCDGTHARIGFKSDPE
ncbi:MAG TPA: ferritin-like domain-containing protein [Polyangiaceae bacterium]|jgi:CDGSH-type Zn-finger protein/uncharacterized Fe-S cluster protein YjdI|nr:ferritin-like domain-containing protein [Polyangiaceae bacterium]